MTTKCIRNIEDNIKRYKDEIQKQNDAIEHANFIKQCVNADLLRFIRNIPDPIHESVFKNAIGFMQKISGDAADYEFLNRLIQEDILGIKYSKKRKSLETIMSLGFGPIAYLLEFNHKHYKFQLTFPINHDLALEDLEYVDYGRVTLHWKDSESSWDWIAGAYDFRELKYAIQNFLEECETKGNKNNV